MAGLKDNSAGVIYLRIKEQKITDSSGKEKSKYGFVINKDDTPSSTLEGVITKMSYRNEEFEGNILRKLIVNVTDPENGDVYQFGLNVESASYSSFVSFLKNVDLTKMLSIHPRLEVTLNKDKQPVNRRSVLISQDGVYAKSYFTKEDNKGLPAWKKVVVNGREVSDKTDYLAFLEQFVEKELIPQVSDIETSTKVAVNTTNKVEDVTPPSSSSNSFIDDDDDKLPWED